MIRSWIRCGGLLAGCGFLLPAQAYNLAAAEAAAAGNASCKQVASGANSGFYWEVGNASGAIDSGVQGNKPPAPSLALYVDSASKWLFAAYVLQTRGGLAGLQPGTSGGYENSDVAYLQMGNGYDNINDLTCTSSDTIGSCYAKGSNSKQTAADVGKFNYSGGEYLAMANNSLGLENAHNTDLASAVGPALGISGLLSYVAPNPAASGQISSQGYAQFLRNIIGGSLKMHDALNADTWCTNSASYGGLLGTKYKYCPTQSSTPPFPNKISFEYGLGQWIETDPNAVAIGSIPADGGVPGDGAHSSPGASGFYPWIDASLTYYGIVAPASAEQLLALDELDYEQTVQCGQAIRQAFLGE